MRIVVLAPPEMAAEFKAKFADTEAGLQPVFLQNYEDLPPHLEQTDVVFDFFLAENHEQLRVYAGHSHLTVFVNAVLVQLASLAAAQDFSCTLFGFNGLPTLFNRPVLEVSLCHASDEEALRTLCKQLGTDILLVEDRVGMVTPRIICMIINEACYTVQEKTASSSDVDLSMKLGTNYPRGPFEWANQLGLRTVCKVLEAVYNDTHEERYKLCPLLKTKNLRSEAF